MQPFRSAIAQPIILLLLIFSALAPLANGAVDPVTELPASQPIEVVSVIGDDAEQVAHHQTPQLPSPEYEPVEALAA